MDKLKPNENVVDPRSLLHKEETKVDKLNNKIALKITNKVGSMWAAYIFTLLALFSLPAVLTGVFPSFGGHLPSWILKTSLIALVAWIAQTFLQLVLLPIIMVGQNVIQDHQEAKTETDHKTLTYLANLQEEQMIELKNQGEILEYLKKEIKK